MPAEVVAEGVRLLALAVDEDALAVRRPTRLEWMWQELPMSFSDGFAMKVAEMPFRNAISLTPFL